MAKAEKLLDVRQVSADGTILTLRLRKVAEPVPPARHLYKYALFYGRPGRRLVLFDNERGKGDHKHIREVESRYCFTTPEQLRLDFLEAVQRIKDEEAG